MMQVCSASVKLLDCMGDTIVHLGGVSQKPVKSVLQTWTEPIRHASVT